MVLLGHSSASIAKFFAAGGLCALIGIAVSYLLGDVPAAVLAFGTSSSAVTGALGGWIGKFLTARHSAALALK